MALHYTATSSSTHEQGENTTTKTLQTPHLGGVEGLGVAGLSEQCDVEGLRDVAHRRNLVSAWSLRQQSAVPLHLVLLQGVQTASLLIVSKQVNSGIRNGCGYVYFTCLLTSFLSSLGALNSIAPRPLSVIIVRTQNLASTVAVCRF